MKTLDAIREAVACRPGELSRARQSGAKVVGYFCCYLPEEVLHALGLIPIRLGWGGDASLVELGTRLISNQNCVFTRQCMGVFMDGKDPYVANSDMVAVAATCFQMYRLVELVSYYCNKETLVLGVPRNFYLPEGHKYFHGEMQEFNRRLESFAGKSLDQAKLQESVALFNDIRRSVADLYRYQAQESPPLTLRDVLEVIQAGFYLDRERYLVYLKELLAEVKKCDEVQVPDVRARLLLSGSIIAPGDTKLLDLVGEMGGRVVADDLCSGLRFRNWLNVKEPTLVGIADAYLDRIPCASLPSTQPIDSDRRFENMLQLIDEYQVEGVLYHSLRFCDPFTFKANATKRFIQQKAGIPFLEIHTEYSPSDTEGIRTRLESFLDIIYLKREEKGGAAC